MKTRATLPHLYIIAGCNGAGKTTASYTILPEILNCKEFVNADSIAAGLSPFNPESVAMEAGRIMLQRIDQLMKEGVNFAFETTLAARSYVSLIKTAKRMDYEVTLLYFWLSSPKVAKERVARRVSMGGHNIPSDIISELSENVLRGVKKAVRKLIEVNAANGEDMVIGDKDGSFKIVPAKELLKGLSKK